MKPDTEQSLKSDQIVAKPLSRIQTFIIIYEKGHHFLYLDYLKKARIIASWLGPFYSDIPQRNLHPFEESYLLNELSKILQLAPSQILDEWKENE